jgi:2-polyprenyl-3-methyl-5-hydroxy-6-metoxy-1,4-benzoquinol methylase
MEIFKRMKRKIEEFINMEINKLIRKRRIPVMEIKCPLCGSKDTQVKYVVTLDEVFSRIDNRSDEMREEIRKIWRGETCKFMDCKDCTFSFAHPFKGGTNKLYSLIYQNNYPTERWEYELALRNISKEDMCLEIGAGNGFFLNKLLKKCKRENIYSVEVSNNKSDYKNVDDIPDEKRFSVFCMFGVLEHLAEFKNVMDKINTTAMENAKLFISVPHKEGVEFFRKKLGYGDNPPIHVSRWNKKTINLLGDWKIVDYRVERLSKFTILKNLFYGFRTIKYPGTHNLFLLMECLIRALFKTGFKTTPATQYFCLEKLNSPGGRKTNK